MSATTLSFVILNSTSSLPPFCHPPFLSCSSILPPYYSAGLGIRSFDFRANRSFFLSKNEPFAQKNERFTHSLIFGERPERFVHDRSFPLSDLSESLMVANFWWATWAIRSHRSFDLSKMSDSLTSLTKKEEMSKNERFANFFNTFF